jgi:hypothetical protein
MSIVPIKGHFENPAAMLHHIAEDQDMTGFVIFVETKQGTMRRAHINFSRQAMAFAGACAISWSQEDEM